MKHVGFLKVLNLLSLLAILLALPLTIFLTQQQQEVRQRAQVAAIDNEEFVGPFPSWNNLKTHYGAVGNGIADDTLALQRALNDLASPSAQVRNSSVLYIPAGTYRITKTLELRSKMGVGVIGEHPDTTKILWDGPAFGTWDVGLPAGQGAMLWVDGVSFSRFGRITWDGAGKALVAKEFAWASAPAPYATTAIENADEVFQNVAFGVRGGHKVDYGNDDTVFILRSKFINCSNTGVSVEHGNVLEWTIRYSYFKNNRVGLGNGQGNFHVYNSVFENSTDADIYTNPWVPFSIRNNFSINSKQFFVGGGQVTLQGNTIIDPANTTADSAPIQHTAGIYGSLLFLDNIIRSRSAEVGPIVQHDGITSVGNQFTVNNAVASGDRMITIDDTVVAPSSIDATIPPLPPTPPNLDRRVFEVPVGADTSTIQGIITEADTFRGQRPVVHFPAGVYSINQTITIPARSDIQLVGDTRHPLEPTWWWTGQTNGPVLKILGPSHVTMRDFGIHGGNTADGVVIEDADQVGARVYIEETVVQGVVTQIGLLAERLAHTDVSIHNFMLLGVDKVGVRAVGSKVNMFGTVGGNAGEASYDVTDGGRLLIQDVDDENYTDAPHFMKLTGTGTFTLHGVKKQQGIYANQQVGVPIIDIDNFQGKATFLATAIQGFIGDSIDTRVPAIGVRGEGRDTKVLLLDIDAPEGTTSAYLVNTSPFAKAVRLQSSGLYPITLIGPVSDIGSADDAFIKEMLEHTRTEKPKLLTPLPDNVTDVRFFRVGIHEAGVGIHIKGASVPITPPLTPINTPTPTRTPTATPTPVSRRPYPDGSLPKQIPGTIQAEDYDIGGEGVSYHDTDSINQGGAYRSDGVDVKVSNDSSF